jgi:hypothetical protein
MTSTVTGLYKSPEAAAEAVRALQGQGIALSDISMVARNDINRDGAEPEPHSKAPQGFAIGAAGGGAMGGLLAGLAAVQSIATGGAGLGLLIAGPVVATLIGAGAGATAGSVVGGMVGAAIPENEAKDYETAIHGGSVLIGVQAEGGNEKKRIKALLEEAGAERVSNA